MLMGQRWEAVPLQPPYHATLWLDVYFLPSNPQFGWVCGAKGHVIRTTDGGATWQGTTVPYSPSNNDHLESIHFVNTSIGYTSGNAGIFKSTDGGATWSSITPASAGNSLWGTHFPTADTGMVIGGGCGVDNIRSFYRTTNGGATWNAFRDTTRVDRSGMSDVFLTSATGAGWAMSSGYLWQTSNGGVTWSVKSPTGTAIWHEEFTKVNNSYLIPTAGTECSGAGNAGGMRFSTDDGTTWNNFSSGGAMFGTFLLDAQRGWAVGVGSRAYYTSDGGQSWALRNCGIKASCDDVWFSDDTTGWIAADGAIYRLRSPYRSTSKTALHFGDRCFPSVSYDTVFVKLQSFHPELATVTIAGTHAADFSIHQPIPPFTINGCDSVRLIVKFTPKDIGLREAIMTISVGSPPTVFSIPLTGKAESITAQSLDSIIVFDKAPCGKISQKSIAVTNGLLQSVQVKKAQKTLGTPEFSFITPLPLIIQPSTTERLFVGVNPVDTGWIAARYVLTVNSCEFIVNARAYGISPIVVHPDKFAMKAQCSPMLTDSIPIENTGNAPLTIYGVTMSTTDPQNFSILGWNKQGDRTTIIQPKHKGWLKIRYAVTSATKISKAILQINCNDSTTKRGNKTAFSVEVDAHFAGPLISTNIPAVTGPEICIGEEKTGTFTVRNLGTTQATMTYIGTKLGKVRVLWREGFPAPQQLANADSAKITVIFKPENIGLNVDTVEIRFQPCGDFIRIPVSCIGKNVVLQAQPDTIKGTVMVGKITKRTVTIRNAGTAVAEITDATLNPNRPDWNLVNIPKPLLLAPGQDYVATVEVNPTTEMTYRGEVCFVATKECVGARCVPIVLQSILTGIGLSTNEILFTPQRCTPSIAHSTFTISNESAVADTITELALIKGAPDFSLIDPPTLPYILAGDQKLFIKVQYFPTNEQNHSGEIRLRSLRSSTAQTVALTSSFFKAQTSTAIQEIPMGRHEICAAEKSFIIPFTNSGLLQDTVIFQRSKPVKGVSLQNDTVIVPPQSVANAEIVLMPNQAALGSWDEIIMYKTLLCPTQGTFSINGEIIQPEFTVRPLPLITPRGALDRQVFDSVIFTNSSVIDREITDITLTGNNCTIIGMRPPPYILAAGASETIRIAWYATIVGTYNAEMNIKVQSECKDSAIIPMTYTIPNVQYNHTVSMRKHTENYATTVQLPLWQQGAIAEAEIDSVNIILLINHRSLNVRNVFRYEGTEKINIPYTINKDTIRLTLHNKDSDVHAQDTLFFVEGYTLTNVENNTPLRIHQYQVFSRHPVNTERVTGSLTIVYGCLVAIPVPVGYIETTVQTVQDSRSIVLEYRSKQGTSPVRFTVTDLMGESIMLTPWLTAQTTSQQITVPGSLPAGIYFITVQTVYSSEKIKCIVQ